MSLAGLNIKCSDIICTHR